MNKKLQDYIVKGKKIFIGREDSKRSWKISARCEGREKAKSDVTIEAKFKSFHPRRSLCA